MMWENQLLEVERRKSVCLGTLNFKWQSEPESNDPTEELKAISSCRIN